MNLVNTPTAKLISGLVLTARNNKAPTSSEYRLTCGSSDSPSSYVSLLEVLMGTARGCAVSIP